MSFKFINYRCRSPPIERVFMLIFGAIIFVLALYGAGSVVRDIIYIIRMRKVRKVLNDNFKKL